MTDHLTDNEVIGAFDGREDGYDEHGVWQKLKYESDWRDLMPVWYKFKELTFEDFGYSIAHEDYCDKLRFSIPERSISESCRLLAEGIRWYNSTQNKQGYINQTVKK